MVISQKAPSRSAQLFKEVQRLSVVGDQHHLVTSCSPCHCQDVVKYQHFPWNKGNNVLAINRKMKRFIQLMLEMHYNYKTCNNKNFVHFRAAETSCEHNTDILITL